ncbi:hypothetical protein LTR87_016077 [Friedmanniomyces endolithicus]|nr:hypothetical protein LTR87_016077 [Friedmanniomyces endolithicus]
MKCVCARSVEHLYAGRLLAIAEDEDDAAVRSKYRQFLLGERVVRTDWVAKIELSTALKMVEADMVATCGDRLEVIVLFGSLRSRSYSRLLSFECAHILSRLGSDVRVFDTVGLPIKDDVQLEHHKVQELRGRLCSRARTDWIPLSTGSVRPTQGRTLPIARVSGGSQSFNTVNSLRILGRWMRMFAIPNQPSVPTAYTQFTDASDPIDNDAYVQAEGDSRMLPSGNRDRLVECIEEFVKFASIMRQHLNLFNDRYSERRDHEAKLDARADKNREEKKNDKAGQDGDAKIKNRM